MNLPSKPLAGLRDHPSNGPNAKTHCFYCRMPLGTHTPECVTQSKTVVVEMTVAMVVYVPQSWDPENIEFYLNDSSHCADNEIEQLYNEAIRDQPKGFCNSCSRAGFKFIRDATEQDHEALAWKDNKDRG